MFRYWIFAVVFIALLSPTLAAKDWVYAVSKGDSLWSISKRYLTKISYYEDIQKLNNIDNPRLLPPGTLIRIPLEWVVNHAVRVKVKSVKGEVHYQSDGMIQPVTLSSEFKLGDDVRVSQNASISLIFADQSEITLSDDVIVKFDHLSQYGKTGMVDTRLRLQQGKVEIRAAKQIGAGSRLDIATVSAITSVRGTIFRVGIDKQTDDTSMIEVLEGEVNVANDNDAVAVVQGFGVKVIKGHPLPIPEKLLAPPQLLTPLTEVTHTNTVLNWQPDPLATGYNIQIATDPQFSSLVLHQYSEHPQLTLPTLSDGDYYLRLSAFSASGLEGMSKPQQLSFNLYPLPPTPERNESLYKNKKPSLSWQSNTNKDQYVIQIAKDSRFNNVIRESVVEGQSYNEISSLPSDQYYWRIASLDDQATPGPFSDVQPFHLSLLLPAPSLKASLREQLATISWPSPEQGQYVEIQTSSDKDFIDAGKVTRTSQNQHLISVTSAKTVYFRARTRQKDQQQAGPWSKPCKVSFRAAFVVCGA